MGSIYNYGTEELSATDEHTRCHPFITSVNVYYRYSPQLSRNVCVLCSSYTQTAVV